MKMDRAEFLAGLMAMSLGAFGCDAKAKKEKASKDDEEESEEEKPKKKKKKKKKAEESDDKPSGTAKTPEPTKPSKPTTGGPDLTAILGTKADGFAPLVFAKLKSGMTTAEAGKVLAGAEKVSEFGFAEIRTGLPAGVAMYQLSFLDKKLAFAAIIFPKAISDDALWAKLVAHLNTKLAPVKSTDADPGKKHMMWIALGTGIITLSEHIGMDDSLGYELSYQLS